jgi:hypothetical protein
MSAIIRSGDLRRLLCVSRGSTVLIDVEIVCFNIMLMTCTNICKKYIKN